MAGHQMGGAGEAASPRLTRGLEPREAKGREVLGRLQPWGGGGWEREGFLGSQKGPGRSALAWGLITGFPLAAHLKTLIIFDMRAREDSWNVRGALLPLLSPPHSLYQPCKGVPTDISLAPDPWAWPGEDRAQT